MPLPNIFLEARRNKQKRKEGREKSKTVETHNIVVNPTTPRGKARSSSLIYCVPLWISDLGITLDVQATATISTPRRLNDGNYLQ
jgi:hypothetical protein